MFAFLSSSTELRRFSKGAMHKLAVVVLLFIPLLYGALYLWAFWDPTGNMNHLPVALVNEDKGAVIDGAQTNAGDEITAELQSRGDLDWDLTDADGAQTGVADGTYYFAVTIPKDFSSAVASPATDTPESAQIQIYYNDANSFLASTLGKSAMMQLRDTVATEIGAKQVDSVLVGLNSASAGFSSAADGAGDLADGVSSAQNGADSLTVGLGTLVSGMTQLQSGSESLASGAGDLGTGASSLAAGLASASTGANSLASGTAALSSGSALLSSSLAQLESSVTADGTGLAAGVSQLSAGLSQLNEGVTGAGGLATQVTALDAGATQVDAGVQKLVAEVNGMPAQLEAIQQLVDAGDTADALAALGRIILELDSGSSDLATLSIGSAQLAAGATALDTGINTGTSSTPALTASVSALTAGATNLDNAVNVGSSTAPSLVSAITQLSSGASTLAAGAADASSGAASLSTGLAQLSSGAGTLAAGTSTLADGANALSDGVASAAPGATQLASGSETLTSGLGTLADGASTLQNSLADGADQTDVGSAAAVTAKANVIADPVTLDTSYEYQAEGFGEGFAPFFISLALFVGGIITWLLLRALPRRALAAGVSGFRAAMAGFVPAAVFGIGQVLVMMGVLFLGLHLQANYVAGTLLFTLLAVFAFLALQQMFIITMGTAAGRVVSLALLMVQLSSSGGTYPVQTTPDFFQAISPWMPITYVVTGLRQLITGELDPRLWLAVAVLAGVLIVSLAISSYAAGRQRVWTIARLHPELSI